MYNKLEQMRTQAENLQRIATSAVGDASLFAGEIARAEGMTGHPVPSDEDIE